MKHAGPATLAQLEPLLEQLRSGCGLVERTPGSFYRKSKAYLHFHEDPIGIFADVKLDAATFTRFEVTTQAQQRTLWAQISKRLAGS